MHCRRTPTPSHTRLRSVVQPQLSPSYRSRKIARPHHDTEDPDGVSYIPHPHSWTVADKSHQGFGPHVRWMTLLCGAPAGKECRRLTNSRRRNGSNSSEVIEISTAKRVRGPRVAQCRALEAGGSGMLRLASRKPGQRNTPSRVSEARGTGYSVSRLGGLMAVS